MPKISQYPSMTTLTGSEIFIGNQGPNTSTGSASQLSTLIQGGFQFTDSGAANAYVLASPKTLNLNPGQLVGFTPLHANTGASTATINGGAAVAIQDSSGNALTGGELAGPVILIWTGAVLQLFWILPTANKYTTAEVAAAATLSITVQALVPKPWFPVGDLRRYGCDITGGTDNSVQITNAIAAAVASGGVGYIYHPGGTIAHASQIALVNNLTVLGYNRAACVFRFTGSPAGSPASTRSAWRYNSIPNGSGYANTFLRHIKIQYVNSINFAGALEFNAGGMNYFEVDDIWIAGSCSFGIILDGTEIMSVHNCLIENLNATVNYNIWIVNGEDRTSQNITFTAAPAQGATSATLTAVWPNTSGTWVIFFPNGEQRAATFTNGSTAVSWSITQGLTTACASATMTAGQGPGFTNVITIRENQISGGPGSIGLADDGGNAHVVQGNNFNQNSIPMTACGTTGLVVTGNSFEAHYPSGATGAANLFMSMQCANSGAYVGPNTGFTIQGNGFYGDMALTHSCLTFTGQLTSISAITQAANAVITVSTAQASNPFLAGQPVVFSGVTGMTQINGLGGYITAVGGQSGAWKITTTINSSAFSAYVSGGQAQMMHAGGVIQGNNFGAVLGRGGAIDVTFLMNSLCVGNIDYTESAGASHYIGVHNDNFGNTLFMPAASFAGGSIGITQNVIGDTRGQIFVPGGAEFTGGAVNLPSPNFAGQTGAIYQGIGAPSNTNGNNGDAYFRTDTPGTANQRLYVKSAGAWVGIL